MDSVPFIVIIPLMVNANLNAKRMLIIIAKTSVKETTIKFVRRFVFNTMLKTPASNNATLMPMANASEIPIVLMDTFYKMVIV